MGNLSKKWDEEQRKLLKPSLTCGLGCPENALSSQTEKFIWDTALSHYLGLKHIRTTKILKIYAFFHPNQAVQNFTT